jgi:hypothetical protein
MTGGFGEATCEACHDGNPINEPGGSLLLDGIPSSYTPSSRYVITVKLARPALAKAGFEIASRFANGEAKGQQAGIWQPTDDRTQLASSPDGTVSYAEQTLKGAGVDPPGAAEWIINWTAPASAAAPIIFNVAANASDDNTSPIGDFIYVAEITSRPPPPSLDVARKSEVGPGGARAAFRPVIQRPGSEPNGRRAALRRSSFLRASGKRMRNPEEL